MLGRFLTTTYYLFAQKPTDRKRAVELRPKGRREASALAYRFAYVAKLILSDNF